MIFIWIHTILCGDRNFIEEMITDIDKNNNFLPKRIENIKISLKAMDKKLSKLSDIVNSNVIIPNKKSSSLNTNNLVAKNNHKEKVEIKKIAKIDKEELKKIKLELIEVDKYKHEFATIQGSVRILNTITRNLDILKKISKKKDIIGKIKGILIYKSNDSYKDYWGRIKFEKIGDKYIDETGYFEGIVCSSFHEIAEEGNITPIGFFQSKKLTRGELGSQFTTTKILVDEIAHDKNQNIKELMEANNDMSVIDKLIFAYAYKKIFNDENKFNDDVKVCVCKDNVCINPCTDFKWVKKIHLM